jgi:hypothetical protein
VLRVLFGGGVLLMACYYGMWGLALSRDKEGVYGAVFVYESILFAS